MNYIKRGSTRIKQEYEFIDFPDAYYKSCCEDNGVKVHLEATLKLDNSPYILIICNVPAKKSAAFENAMRDLERKMLICRHNEYPEFCESYFNKRELLNNPKCPKCKSDNIAMILYDYPNLPLFIKRRVKKKIKNNEIVLSNCKATPGEDNDQWHCNDCGCKF